MYCSLIYPLFFILLALINRFLNSILQSLYVFLAGILKDKHLPLQNCSGRFPFFNRNDLMI